MNSIEWNQYSDSAVIPTRLDEIHYTFKSDELVSIPPGEIRSVSTQIGFTLANSNGGLVYPLSGIYSLYFPRFMKSTGNQALTMRIINFGNEPLIIQKGRPIIRMLLQHIAENVNFQFTKMDVNAIDPVRSENSGGWMVKSPSAFVIPPGESQEILTGISTTGVPGYHAYIYPVHEFGVSNYLIEPDQNIHMRMSNCTQDPINISRGDELGVLTLNEAIDMDLVEIQAFPRLPTTPIKRRG